MSLRCRPAPYALAAMVCGFLLAACGSSGGASTATAGVGGGLKFARCMRAHGVPNFPDPAAGGGGFQLVSRIDPQSPAFRAARQACAQLSPASHAGAQATESQFRAALKFAHCMRGHGFSSFHSIPRARMPAGRRSSSSDPGRSIA